MLNLSGQKNLWTAWIEIQKGNNIRSERKSVFIWWTSPSARSCVKFLRTKKLWTGRLNWNPEGKQHVFWTGNLSLYGEQSYVICLTYHLVRKLPVDIGTISLCGSKPSSHQMNDATSPHLVWWGIITRLLQKQSWIICAKCNQKTTCLIQSALRHNLPEKQASTFYCQRNALLTLTSISFEIQAHNAPTKARVCLVSGTQTSAGQQGWQVILHIGFYVLLLAACAPSRRWCFGAHLAGIPVILC